MNDKLAKLIEVRYILSDALEDIKQVDHHFSEALMESHIQVIDDLIASGGDDYIEELADKYDVMLNSEAEGQLQ